MLIDIYFQRDVFLVEGGLRWEKEVCGNRKNPSTPNLWPLGFPQFRFSVTELLNSCEIHFFSVLFSYMKNVHFCFSKCMPVRCHWESLLTRGRAVPWLETSKVLSLPGRGCWSCESNWTVHKRKISLWEKEGNIFPNRIRLDNLARIKDRKNPIEGCFKKHPRVVHFLSVFRLNYSQ